jgi:purine-binding chemotaxis protein CheW
MANEYQLAEANEPSIEQYLTFTLAGESYGLEILKVREIRGWEPVREIPNTPEYIKGALNLRGTIVPIIDLRERFGMEKVEYSPITVVIVLSFGEKAENRVIGIVADGVSDVLDINLQDVRSPPNLGSKIDTRYMQGLYVQDTRMIMLLDVNNLLNPEEFENLVE